jgi:hypothetical protein
VIRAALPAVIRQFEIRSMLDIPCGDFHWMKEVDLGIEFYIGADIVKKLVAKNKKRFTADSRIFAHLDVLRDALPKVDLIFCRDCLVHFSFSDIWRALNNIVDSGSKYLMTTTFTLEKQNRDVPTGGWRRLNLCGAPFDLPPPALLINENCPIPKHPDKSLALWPIAAIAKRLEETR